MVWCSVLAYITYNTTCTDLWPSSALKADDSIVIICTFCLCRQAISFDPSTQPRGAHPSAVKIDRFSSILSAILSVGEHEKVAQGIFENYPNTKYRDPSMRVVSGAKAGLLNHSHVQCGYSLVSAIVPVFSVHLAMYELFCVCCMYVCGSSSRLPVCWSGCCSRTWCSRPSCPHRTTASPGACPLQQWRHTCV